MFTWNWHSGHYFLNNFFLKSWNLLLQRSLTRATHVTIVEPWNWVKDKNFFPFNAETFKEAPNRITRRKIFFFFFKKKKKIGGKVQPTEFHFFSLYGRAIKHQSGFGLIVSDRLRVSKPFLLYDWPFKITKLPRITVIVITGAAWMTHKPKKEKNWNN